MKLSLGPIPYFWSREAVIDFYRAVESLPVDVVYLGETVCAKRRVVRLSDWIEIGSRLSGSGKEVVLSTLVLIEAESEVSSMRRIVENGCFAVEANDTGVVNLLQGAPFVCGPHINVYNAEAIALMAEAGAFRWVVPIELSRAMLEPLQAARPSTIETEVLAFGRLPLAYSARCFTARAHNVAKDECGFRCGDYPAGMTLLTQEGEPFLVLNGVQVQSATVYSLIGEIAGLGELGVDVMRLTPMPEVTPALIQLIRAVLNGEYPAPEAAAQAAQLAGVPLCDGYWRGAPGMNAGHGVPG